MVKSSLGVDRPINRHQGVFWKHCIIQLYSSLQCLFPPSVIACDHHSSLQNVEKLNGVGICQIECGAQFSLALSRNGLVWTWGKGDYFRLGHGSDQHVRKPTVVECLRGKKIVHVAVGALHCLAVR